MGGGIAAAGHASAGCVAGGSAGDGPGGDEAAAGSGGGTATGLPSPRVHVPGAVALDGRCSRGRGGRRPEPGGAAEGAECRPGGAASGAPRGTAAPSRGRGVAAGGLGAGMPLGAAVLGLGGIATSGSRAEEVSAGAGAGPSAAEPEWLTAE